MEEAYDMLDYATQALMMKINDENETEEHTITEMFRPNPNADDQR